MTRARHAHVLQPVIVEARPTSVIFFDTETRTDMQPNGSKKHRLKLGCASHCYNQRGEVLKLQKSIVYRSPLEFWEFVNSRCREKSLTYLTAHNIVFDLTVLDGFRQLPDHGWKLDSFYTKGIVSLFRWSNGTRKIVCLDNTNLFPGKLARWGELLDKPKLSVDFDTVSDQDLITYCQRDVEIMVDLWRLWLKFLDDNKLGSFKPTLASTAFNAWRFRFLKDKVHIHADAQALALERESYHGARVECLWTGHRDDGPFYYLDANSMYGYILSRYNFPAGLYSYTDHASIYHLMKRLEKCSVIAQVTLKTDDNPFPVMVDGHLAYPLGEFWTTLTTPELLLAAERGWLREVHSMAWYRQAPIFRTFILELYELRKSYQRSGNSGFSEISKLLMNSLYGKFGQNGIVQTVIGSCPLEELWSETIISHTTGKVYRHLALAGQIYEERHEGEGYHSFPAIAAHVTAYARLYLWRLMRKVPPEHVFYVDTDSLIVDQVGLESLKPLLSATELGLMKVELTSPWLIVNAPKDYAMLDRRRLKGVSLSAKEIEPGVFAQDQWVRLSGMLRAGDMNGFTVKQVVKRQRRVIHSGLVLPSGWVQPFVLRLAEPVALEESYSEIAQPQLLP